MLRTLHGIMLMHNNSTAALSKTLVIYQDTCIYTYDDHSFVNFYKKIIITITIQKCTCNAIIMSWSTYI